MLGLATTSPICPIGVTRSHCACPETKKAHGESITEQEEHCGQLTEAHKECMRALGLKI
uniref:Cytochrome c oxidase copper chaperone COX17 n=1 Tax=Capra hircus TaxID=9925 RepID=A0A8C2NYA7_CAPHI